MFQIEKNVPLPSVCDKYPFAQMEVGHSFAVPVDDTPQRTRMQICSSAQYYKKSRHKEFKWATRYDKDANAVRFWRLR